MIERDPLEDELAEMRPRNPSLQLKHRIAEQLDSPAIGRLPSRYRRSAILVGLVITGIAMVFLYWPQSKPVIDPPESIATPEPFESLDESLPSLWSYRSAMTRSPQSLDALFDRYAVPDTQLNREQIRAFPFARFDSVPIPSPGEL